ncbi:RNase adapter RapZ [Limnochorda pilosa]|uniref:GlmZ(SRNA)-inactivating NTPase n=1 Tax=Limnochorda pilosa TaxID=1555112 RepID=A0A0K2SJ68_LIMPI|nr:RNase adapter RapZ [Limnochorda pilosa]BAS27140.1 glmZ(sRNA)-inactivating NTPase [Limnochorda pilosa]
MQFILVTGLSGAGKSEAIHAFEDLGFFCVDNLPPALIPKFAELCLQSQGRITRVALVCDIRGGLFFQNLFEALKELEQLSIHYQILFLEASDDVLVRRFKETRRRHPLVGEEGTVLEGIRKERKVLDELRGRATVILDTSHLTGRELRSEIAERYGGEPNRRMVTTLVSFGYKHGIPLDSDLVLDVRFLPNPHYVESLKQLTGNDARVEEYVLRWPAAQRFLQEAERFLSFLVPHYVQEGKSHLVVGVGCTGGQHRSVVIANRLADFLRSQGYPVVVEHRELSETQGKE